MNSHTTSDRIETKQDFTVDLFYPNIYPKTAPLPRVTIGLTHTRAADDITVEFDGDRNGWVLRMDRIKWSIDGWAEMIEEKAEVGFIPAWNEV